MPVSRGQAKEICTKPEYELVETSFRPGITELTPKRLGSKVARARRLEEKYRDLARKQGRETKRASGASAQRRANQRTQRKARLFGETRERYEKRLAQLEAKSGAGASPGRAARQTASRQSAAARRKERRKGRRELR